MAKLIIKFEDVIIDQMPLKQGDMAIGRRPGSDILLDNLAVSGNHATLFTIGEDTFIQDLNSTNGTFVNNKKVAKHHLVDGDMIVIGKHTLIYVNENAAKPANNLAKTVIITPPRHNEPPPPPSPPAPAAAVAAPHAPAHAAAAPAAAPKEARTGAIFVLSGANSGKRIDLTRPVTNLGRAGKMAATINRNANGGYSIIPGTEPEKPKVNGVTVRPLGEELKHGDIIEIAGSRMQFNLR